MRCEWREFKIGDLCSQVYSGGTPNTKNNEYYMGGTIPWLNTSEIKFNRIYNTEKYITDSGLLSSSAKWVPINAVIVAMYGATAARVAISKIPLTTNQACCNLIIDESKANYNYVYYWLCLQYEKLASLANGGAQQNLNTRQIKEFPIIIPPLTEQEKISSILSLLDDKIELNNRINENLEQQARAIFRAWFVDFLPFNGVMPSDWKIETLGNVTVNLRERVKDKINYPVFSAISSGDLILSDDFFSKRVYSKNISNYIIVNENNFAYNPARINIGSIGINDFDYKGCVSPVYIVLKVAEGYEGYFYFYFKSKRFRAESLLRASGSVRQTLNYSDFSLIEVIYPSREYAEKFNDIYQTLCKAKKTYNNQTRTLAQIRDSLLPKLISGELDISGLDLSHFARRRPLL